MPLEVPSKELSNSILSLQPEPEIPPELPPPRMRCCWDSLHALFRNPTPPFHPTHAVTDSRHQGWWDNPTHAFTDSRHQGDEITRHMLLQTPATRGDEITQHMLLQTPATRGDEMTACRYQRRCTIYSSLTNHRLCSLTCSVFWDL